MIQLTLGVTIYNNLTYGYLPYDQLQRVIFVIIIIIPELILITVYYVCILTR